MVTTGGVSVGDEDHMPAVLRAAGGEIHVMKVAMKPGKPLVIGRIGAALYVGLPGNPVAAFVCWHVIGARIARGFGGNRGRRSAPHSSCAPASNGPATGTLRIPAGLPRRL